VFGGGEAKNEFLNRIYQNLVAHVINLVTFKLFYAQIRQNLKLFEAEFWEFSEPSFGAASRGLKLLRIPLGQSGFHLTPRRLRAFWICAPIPEPKKLAELQLNGFLDIWAS
jgi:hypothetical protein